MQEQQLDALALSAFSDAIRNPEKIAKKVNQITDRNRKALENIDLPDKHRIPTADDIARFREYGVAYKRQNKNASKREIRKAIQKEFNIVIYK